MISGEWGDRMRVSHQRYSRIPFLCPGMSETIGGVITIKIIVPREKLRKW